MRRTRAAKATGERAGLPQWRRETARAVSLSRLIDTDETSIENWATVRRPLAGVHLRKLEASGADLHEQTARIRV